MAEGTDLEKENFWSWDVWQNLWPFHLFYFCPLSAASAGLFPSSLTHTSSSSALPLLSGLAPHCSGQPSLLCLLLQPYILVTRALLLVASGSKPSLGDICHRMETPRCLGPQVPTLAHKHAGLRSGWEGNGRCQDLTPQAQPTGLWVRLMRTLGQLPEHPRDKPFS